MRRRSIPLVSILFALTSVVPADAAAHKPRVGDTYEITINRESTQSGSDGSSGSSSDTDILVERVTAVRDAGLELEYDLPKNAAAEDRANNWKFPARIFRPSNGLAQLLNAAELESRVDPWLKGAKWTRAICGHWIFTWNAFYIDCDPQSVLPTIEAFGAGSSAIHDRDSYSDPNALTPQPVRRKSSTSTSDIFEVTLNINPAAVHRERAEAAVAVAKISRKTLSLDAALSSADAETISGTIFIAFDTDSFGAIWRRTKVTKMIIVKPDGQRETQTVTETLQRRLVETLTPHSR